MSETFKNCILTPISKIICPYCIHNQNETDKHFIRAEYWRRHVTEVHKNPDEVIATRNLVICLPCYNKKLEEGKEQKKNSQTLPDFDGLCATEEQKQVLLNDYMANEI